MSVQPHFHITTSAGHLVSLMTRQPANMSCMQASCAQLQVLTRQMQLRCAWQERLLRLQARALSRLPGLLRRQP